MPSIMLSVQMFFGSLYRFLIIGSLVLLSDVSSFFVCIVSVMYLDCRIREMIVAMEYAIKMVFTPVIIPILSMIMPPSRLEMINGVSVTVLMAANPVFRFSLEMDSASKALEAGALMIVAALSMSAGAM